MYPGVWSIAVLEGILLIWLIGLTVLVKKNSTFLKKLFPSSLSGDENFQKRIEEMFKEMNVLREFKRQNLNNIQKLALKRYNPYQDTGGDQSFSLSLLDGKGCGVVITSLHSRAGTRVFAKPVREGKEDKFEFSEEEKQVISEAITLND